MSMGLARRLALVIVSSVVALVVAPFASASQPAPSPKVPCAPMVALVFKDDGGSFLAPVGEEDLLPARLVTQSRGFCANSQATGFDSGTASTFDGSSATTGFPTFHGSAPSDNEHRSSRAVYRQQISRALTYDPSPSSTTVSQFVATNTGRSALNLSDDVATQVDDAIARASQGQVRFPGHDGKAYLNRDGLLPERGDYTEWTAAASGAKRGADRVIIAGNPASPDAIYYWDHVNPPVRIGP